MVPIQENPFYTFRVKGGYVQSISSKEVGENQGEVSPGLDKKQNGEIPTCFTSVGTG